MFTTLKKTGSVILIAGFTFATSSALANGYPSYHVTITNLTNSITFTPILVASPKLDDHEQAARYGGG